MNSHPARFEELERRLLSVEKQNRRLKQLGAAALMAVALLVVMGQASSKKTVEANEFILRDASGNVRAKLSMSTVRGYPASPQLVLFDEAGKLMVSLDGNDVSAGLTLFDSESQPDAGLDYSRDKKAGLLWLGGKNPLRGTRLTDGLLSLEGADGFALLTQDSLELIDTSGFKAELGATSLTTPRTGETRKTSAASLVLFDKDKNVIWKAP